MISIIEIFKLFSERTDINESHSESCFGQRFLNENTVLLENDSDVPLVDTTESTDVRENVSTSVVSVVSDP